MEKIKGFALGVGIALLGIGGISAVSAVDTSGPTKSGVPPVGSPVACDPVVGCDVPIYVVELPDTGTG
jgi:hypothetical protein